jgi:MFS family permease
VWATASTPPGRTAGRRTDRERHLLIALYAFAGAAASGLAGAGVLRLIRRRSLTASLTVVAAVGVVAMLAGTLAVAWAMFYLAIVRGIVEAHQGRATVRNIPGGCRFEVVLPAAAS